MKTETDKSVIRNSFREQAALTQLHRWIAFCLAEDAPSERIADLLGEQSKLIIGEDTVAEGPAEMIQLARSTGISAIISPDVAVVGDLGGDFGMRAVGRSTTGTRAFQQITFTFDWTDCLEPLLHTISYSEPGGEKPVIEPIEPMASRLLSVSHRWHVLVEDPERTPEPFQEIISEDFVMEYGHGAVRSYDELVDWVTGSASSVGASRHDLVGLKCERLGPGVHRAEFVLDWNGLTHDGKNMTAQTRHTWRIRDVPAARFPVIEHIDVEFLQPFKVIE
ncbi:hypothetical protein SAMN02745824_1411 [Parasphingorhabdus marina DSM 22363]|uniref:SnoaL-like domain-containing protein n=1 Tax=Parasphingorhabdus marina DSM 22363 TaxID=1123272 RepID=A0A1N6D1H4_9SPHN|nr:hypothetical protein [Parasphingorhabdus marina]SIN64584.1 hypothetical protein SAMN02745824_1411 [Parasphingorhabdus marina DSM 22363]